MRLDIPWVAHWWHWFALIGCCWCFYQSSKSNLTSFKSNMLHMYKCFSDLLHALTLHTEDYVDKPKVGSQPLDRGRSYSRVECKKAFTLKVLLKQYKKLLVRSRLEINLESEVIHLCFSLQRWESWQKKMNGIWDKSSFELNIDITDCLFCATAEL